MLAFDAAFWATIALFIFIGVVVYLKLPAMITKALDARIAKIETELAEAERLRAEAKTLLDQYAKKRADADKEAEGIVLAAREEAFRLTGEASASLETLIARRTKAVEEKIAQAEAQAVAEVRARSADLAVEAARLLLQTQMKDKGPALVDKAIRDVAGKLN
jgi:F-type H+-transporting ATPase subunit b